MHQSPHIAIACGGTGGHLFPGLAVASQLLGHGCQVTLLVSPKEVDQQAVRTAVGVRVATLPAVGLTQGGGIVFLRGFIQSYRAARRLFQANPPRAVLGMGGFTSAPPILAARRLGARTFLHESNTVPGRANRWLSWLVDEAYVGFASAGGRLHNRRVKLTGTPVRAEFVPRDAAVCRAELGLDPERPVVLVMGGSQGAAGVNELVINSLPLMAQIAPRWQWVHLTGLRDGEKVKAAYLASKLDALVHPFFARVDLVLGAATATISRSGASSLAELAATRSPAILVPLPAATDNHQFFNARAFADTGAARILDQKTIKPEALVPMLQELVENTVTRATMKAALVRWHAPLAANQIAESVLRAIGIGPARTGDSQWGARESANDSTTGARGGETESAFSGPGPAAAVVPAEPEVLA